MADIIHHVEPLARRHFGAMARAAGLTPREAGAALTQLRDDHFTFRRDEALALMAGLQELAIAGAEGFDLAVVILLADLLQTRRGAGLLAEVWPEAGRRWPMGWCGRRNWGWLRWRWRQVRRIV